MLTLPIPGGFGRFCVITVDKKEDAYALIWIYLPRFIISYVGSKDHIKTQGEILEGLVARIVSPESSKQLEDVLKEFPLPPNEGGILLSP